MSNKNRLSIFLPMMVALSLAGGCSSMPEPDESYAPPPPAQPVAAPATPGAIYQSGGEVRLFEDLKANRVGDILTVRLVEQTNASKNANTSTSKSSSASIANPVIFGRPVTSDGVPILEGSLGSDTAFDGAGSSSQSNSLRGDITVTVVERYPNGNLLIRGEKWLTLNQGKEFIRLSGIVRPYDIEPDNSLLSGKIADAQITYSSKGVMAAANRMGLVSRFFHSVLMP
ncbi:MAG TPA: flagellar basal body L-ring protein FlgH [Woeseiaceae bacterium]|nr:flagellar basal body L-ring protein FlgH [Woeseiaceae bacterium]